MLLMFLESTKMMTTKTKTTTKPAISTMTTKLITILLNNSKQDIPIVEEITSKVTEDKAQAELGASVQKLSTKQASQFISIPSEMTKELDNFAINSAGNAEQESSSSDDDDAENRSKDEISVITLSALLGSIYGLAFIFAIIWITWLYIRKRNQTTSFKSAGLMMNPHERCRDDSLSVCSNH